MKNYIIGIALALALVMGVVAFAETAEPATDPVPAVTEEVPAVEAATDAAETDKTNDNAALQEALEAYRSAQESKRVDDLTEELNGYMEAGTMTQEQADLILSYVKEWIAAKNGECPNCGYQFQNSAPKMGGQKGQRGGRMMQGGRMNGQMPGGQMPGNQTQPFGQMPGGNQQPDATSGTTPQQ